jgi:hypothetical protein
MKKSVLPFLCGLVLLFLLVPAAQAGSSSHTGDQGCGDPAAHA